MASIGDVIQITFKHTLLNQEVINVGYWTVGALTTGDAVLFTVGDEFVSDYEANVMVHLSTALVFQGIELLNLSDGLEFGIVPANTPGSIVGSPLPAFNAISYKLNRSTRLTRNGSKRVAGLIEANTEDGNILMTPAELDSIGTFWSNIKNYTDYDGQGNTFAARPVIVGRTKDVDGKYQLDLNKINNITGNEYSTLVSSQVSRKP